MRIALGSPAVSTAQQATQERRAAAESFASQASHRETIAENTGVPSNLEKHSLRTLGITFAARARSSSSSASSKVKSCWFAAEMAWTTSRASSRFRSSCLNSGS